MTIAFPVLEMNMKDMGIAKRYLGIEITRDRKNRILYDQQQGSNCKGYMVRALGLFELLSSSIYTNPSAFVYFAAPYSSGSSFPIFRLAVSYLPGCFPAPA